MRKIFKTLTALAFTALPVAGFAQCGGTHTVASGDTIFSIAEQYYEDHNQWSLIYYGNQVALQGAMFELPQGVELSIPCVNQASAPDEKPLLQNDAEMRLVTGSNYAPFTDKSWPGEGMVTELVNAALEASPHPVPFAITWEDDWSKHLFPILDEKQADMGFPWLKPNCDEDTGNERCANFHFSEPLVEILVLLFTRKDDPLTFEKDSDLHGKTICRPTGYFTHDLDRADRQWLSKNLVTLEQPASPDACFELLMTGKVDAVTVNEFLGWTKIHDLGLKNNVVAVKRPLSIEGLHVIISKRDWRGTTHLYRFNSGLESLKASKRYDEIVSRHLGIFWDQIN